MLHQRMSSRPHTLTRLNIRNLSPTQSRNLPRNTYRYRMRVNKVDPSRIRTLSRARFLDRLANRPLKILRVEAKALVTYRKEPPYNYIKSRRRGPFQTLTPLRKQITRLPNVSGKYHRTSTQSPTNHQSSPQSRAIRSHHENQHVTHQTPHQPLNSTHH